MPDIADQADDEIEQTLQRALRARAPELVPRGTCHNCDQPVRRLFCDLDCRDDWERRARR